MTSQSCITPQRYFVKQDHKFQSEQRHALPGRIIQKDDTV